MAAEILVQTVLPRALGKWVKQQADSAGLSTAAWLRRLIMQAQSELWVRAWSIEPGHPKANSSNWFASRSQNPPHILLERAGVHSDGTIEFRAFDVYARTGTPLFAEVLGTDPYRELRRNLDEGWLVLEGSTEPWTVVRKVADGGSGGQIVLFLRTVKPTTTYYAFADAYHSPPRCGLAMSDPPVTGGIVFWQFETEETDPQKRLAALAAAGPKFQLENERGQAVGQPCQASQIGLDEAVMEGSALAQAEPGRVLRLVTGRPNEAKVLLRSWPRTA